MDKKSQFTIIVRLVAIAAVITAFHTGYRMRSKVKLVVHRLVQSLNLRHFNATINKDILTETHENKVWQATFLKNNMSKHVIKELQGTCQDKCSGISPCITYGTPTFGRYGNIKQRIIWWHHQGGMQSCPWPCQVVSDIRQADAVIFHGRDIKKKFPWQLHWNQTRIYFNQEGPYATQQYGYNVQGDPQYRFFFNFTATYKRSADIYCPYALLKKFSNSSKMQQHYNPKSKTKFAYVAISNCNPFNRRSHKVRELQKHFLIDIFGSCSGKRLKETFQKAGKNYRFYLSFENAFCKDYITEKFFNNALRTEAVPVVFGGLSREDYEAIAPPKSFIYALDFPTARELGSFLKNLVANETEYASYFKWKDNYNLDGGDDFTCMVCKKLYEYAQRRHVADLESYYNVSRECRPRDFKYLQ